MCRNHNVHIRLRRQIGEGWDHGRIPHHIGAPRHICRRNAEPGKDQAGPQRIHGDHIRRSAKTGVLDLNRPGHRVTHTFLLHNRCLSHREVRLIKRQEHRPERITRRARRLFISGPAEQLAAHRAAINLHRIHNRDRGPVLDAHR